MKRLTTYVTEKFRANKDMFVSLTPKSFNELRKIIEQRYEKQGSGTKQNPIDFNDIDISNITTFYNTSTKQGIFEGIEFEYIDISNWDVSNVKDMSYMFYKCENLKSVGELLEWNVSNVETFRGMFFDCRRLENIGDLTEWEITDKLRDTCSMFCMCFKLKNIGNISKWDVSNVKNMSCMFKTSGIANKPKWYKG